MTKFYSKNNIATKKTIFVAVFSLLITYFLSPKKDANKNNKKNKSLVKSYRKIYGLLLGLTNIITSKKVEPEIEKNKNTIKVEQAIIFDL